MSFAIGLGFGRSKEGCIQAYRKSKGRTGGAKDRDWSRHGQPSTDERGLESRWNGEIPTRENGKSDGENKTRVI